MNTLMRYFSEIVVESRSVESQKFTTKSDMLLNTQNSIWTYVKISPATCTSYV